MTSPAATRDVAAPLLALAALLLGHALQMRNGFYDPAALLWVGVAFLLALLAVVGPREIGRLDRGDVTSGVLMAGILSNLVALAAMPVGMYLAAPMPRDHPALMVGLLVVGLLVLLGCVAGDGGRRTWFVLLLAAYLTLGVWLIRASPEPRIDVLVVHREAIAALLDGKSPYAIRWPDIYGTGEFYGPNMTAAGHVLFGYPYPPLSLLLALPGELLLGDIRYAELVAMTLAGALIGFVRPGRVAPLAATLLLFTPRTFFVLEQAWTEPFAVLLLAATLWTAAHRPRALPWALGLLIAVKQHMVLALPLAVLLVSPGASWKDVARLTGRAAAVAAAITLPFLLWRTRRFVEAVVLLQFREPFRLDSLSLPAHLARNGLHVSGETLVGLAILALMAGIGVSLWRAPRTPAGFAGSMALALLLVFAVSKKAFCNYYFFVIAAMVSSVAVSARAATAATAPAVRPSSQ